MRMMMILTEEAYRISKTIAHDRAESLGAEMSELIVKGAVGQVRLVNGWPVVSIWRPVTMEAIQDFLAEED